METNISTSWTWSRKNVVIVCLVALPYVAAATYFVAKKLGTPTYVIASGTEGGLYNQVGTELGRYLNYTSMGKMRFEVVPTDGSTDNIQRIQNDKAQLALAQDGLVPGPKVRALASLYSSPLQIVVLRNSGIQNIRGFLPKNHKKFKVYLGLPGSGTRVVSEQVLSHYDVPLSDLEVEDMGWSFTAAADALEKGNIDAAFFLVGFGSDAVNRLAKDGRFTLVSIDRADGLTTAYPYLRKTEIPPGAYASSANFPDAPISTVETRELLVCSRDISTSTAYGILDDIYAGTPELVRDFPLLTQLSQIDPQRNFYYPLHPGAISYYRRENAPQSLPWPLITAGGGYTITLGTLLLIRLHRRRVRPLLTELDRIDAEIRKAGQNISGSRVHDHEEALRDVQRRAIGLYVNGKIKSDPYDSLKDYIRFCFQELRHWAAGRDDIPEPLVEDVPEAEKVFVKKASAGNG